MATIPSGASINPSNPCEYQLYHVLERANLLGYFSSFIQQGGDDVRQLCEASEGEFMEILTLVGMASKPLHIRRLHKSLQEWAKDNNVPFMQSQSSCQPQLGSMPYASALAGLQPQSHGMGLMAPQWLNAHQQAAAGQWTGSQLASGQSSPSDSGQNPASMPYTEHTMHQSLQQVPQQTCSKNGSIDTCSSSKALPTKAESSDLQATADPCTLRHVAQRIMASHTPSPISQTSHNKKLLQSVQHIIDMSADHPQRLEEIQKWAPIYGRFDSKRKDDKPLTAHEISVNESAIQLCCLDPYLLVQRDKLFPLARQVVRDSGYQFKHGHSRSVKVVEGKTDDITGSKPKRLKVDSGASSHRESEIATPNPRTVQAEILKLRREERMNEIMLNLNNIVQKQSDIKASIVAAQSQDNIQEVYDLKVQLEKLTTQQLLLMTEQTDLIKRQRRSDRYYVAKARAEEENGDLADRLNAHEPRPADEMRLTHPVDSDDGRSLLQANTALSVPPGIEDNRTEQDGESDDTSLAQTLLMQHTLMDEGLRVAQNYAINGKVKAEAVRTNKTEGQQVKTERPDTESQDESASRDAEFTITALLSLSSNKDRTQENCDIIA